MTKKERWAKTRLEDKDQCLVVLKKGIASMKKGLAIFVKKEKDISWFIRRKTEKLRLKRKKSLAKRSVGIRENRGERDQRGEFSSFFCF